MQSAKPAKRNPRDLAHNYAMRLQHPQAQSLLASAEIAGSTVNRQFEASGLCLMRLRLKKNNTVAQCAKQAKRLAVEFVSANPTGPLHVGQVTPPAQVHSYLPSGHRRASSSRSSYFQATMLATRLTPRLMRSSSQPRRIDPDDPVHPKITEASILLILPISRQKTTTVDGQRHHSQW